MRQLSHNILCENTMKTKTKLIALTLTWCICQFRVCYEVAQIMKKPWKNDSLLFWLIYPLRFS